MVVVLADDLDQQVEAARGDDDVVDLGHLRERVGDALDVALDVDADHGLAAEAHLERVGDRDDLHDAGVEQPLHPLAHGGLGQADGLADRGVGLPAVLLQLLDDRLGESSSTTAGGRRSTVRTLEVAGLRVVTAPIVARGSMVGKSPGDGIRDNWASDDNGFRCEFAVRPVETARTVVRVPTPDPQATQESFRECDPPCPAQLRRRRLRRPRDRRDDGHHQPRDGPGRRHGPGVLRPATSTAPTPPRPRPSRRGARRPRASGSRRC